MLTDNFVIEQYTIEKDFGRLVDSKIEMAYLLYKVHTLYTLCAKPPSISNTKVQEYLKDILYNWKTKTQCDKLI